MLIARAPFRISLAGGGTDLPAYYRQFGGCVVSTSIDKYIYAVLSVNQTERLQISSADYGTFYRHDTEGLPELEGDLKLPRAVLQHFGIGKGIRLFTASEVPPGTGLGSSSAVAVALVKVISAACQIDMSPVEIAELACDIEIRKLGTPIGKQDQYASAVGGCNFIQFHPDGVEVQRLRMHPGVASQLEKSLLLFYTGAARNSGTILSEQSAASQRGDRNVMGALHAAKELAFEMKAALESGDLDSVGELIDLGWQQKKRFASRVSGPFVDECYQCAKEHGALGGKLNGAGGGGFLMLFCPVRRQPAVTRALQEKGLKRLDFAFDRSGARVLMNASLSLTREGAVA